MARLALLVLLLANIGYFAWSQDWLRDFGLAPERQGEPQRIAQQIRPDMLRIVERGDPDEAAVERPLPAPAMQAPAASAPAAAVPLPEMTARTSVAPQTRCLQAGPFNATQAAALESALRDVLPEGHWRFDAPVPLGGQERWIVLFEADARSPARTGEDRDIGAARPDAADATTASRGLESFGSEAEAQARLEALAASGVGSARLQRPAMAEGRRLVLPAADAAARGQVQALEPWLSGLPLEPCDAASVR